MKGNLRIACLALTIACASGESEVAVPTRRGDFMTHWAGREWLAYLGSSGPMYFAGQFRIVGLISLSRYLQ